MQTSVRPSRDRRELALQLPPTAEPVELERPLVDSGKHGAVRLVHVRAVRETTFRRERLDIRERRTAVAVEELQLTQAGRVDHECAAGETDQLPVRRRVATGSV